jgi:DNA transformation protein
VEDAVPEIKLIELKNLGAASVNILNAIGVRTLGDLEAVGSAQAYRRIRQRGIRVSLAMLYAMEGALLDVHWKSLEADVKARLVQTAEHIEQEELIPS